MKYQHIHEWCVLIFFLQVDVSDQKCIEEVKRKINADLGVVDILVNNAGLMPKNSFRGGDAESIRRIMDVNVLAHFWVSVWCFFWMKFVFLNIQ